LSVVAEKVSRNSAVVRRIIIMLVLLGVGVGVICALQICLIAELTIEDLSLAGDIVHGTF